MLSAEELLAGGSLYFDVPLPAHVVRPYLTAPAGADVADPDSVRLRPLTVSDLQIIARATRESDDLAATLMVQRALVEPAMSVAQVAAMHTGLVQFLLSKVQEISGITMARDDIAEAVADPLARAAFVLAQEFGWTPQQINELTLGQILLNLKMLQAQDAAHASTAP